jgi:hypothetical protein
MNRADMQRDNNVEGRLAVQCGVISKTADRRNRVPSRGEGVIRDRGDGTWLGDRKSPPRRRSDLAIVAPLQPLPKLTASRAPRRSELGL